MLKALHHIHAMRGGAKRHGESRREHHLVQEPERADRRRRLRICGRRDEAHEPASDEHASDVLQGMMEQSDNRKTDAVYDRFGPGAINATADWLGMTKTQLNHRIGCTWAALARWRPRTS
jgi:Beta-lactamase enzyme family